MSEHFSEIMSEIGSTPEEMVGAIYESSEEDFLDLAVDLAIAVRPEATDLEPFSFVANSSLSGRTHPCAEFTCREKKLEELASFAALYGDTVYIQDPFESIIIEERQDINNVDRNNLAFGISTYMYLFPLIERGLIKFAQSSVCLCDHHKAEIGEKLHDKRLNLEEQIYDRMKDAMIDRCSFEVDVGKSGQPHIKLSGPDELVGHGVRFLHFNFYVPKEIEVLAEKHDLPYRMTAKEIESSYLVEQWIKPVIDDLFFQEWHSTFYGTKFLTDNETQIELASSVTDPDKYASSRALSEGLRHNMPAIFSKSVNDILALRDREPEAFYVYRDKLNKLINNSYGWKSQDIHQMFEQEVLPEINQINNKVKNWKTSLRDGTKSKLLFGAGTVAAGLYSGILPTDIGKIVAAVGGYSGVSSLLENYNKSLKGEEEAKKNDMYFLWKAGK